MTANTYNGWTNWSTWQINLWLDNEEPWYRAKQRFLRAGDFSEDAVKAFCVEQFGKEGTPDMDQPGEWEAVNWTEIAESFEREAEES